MPLNTRLLNLAPQQSNIVGILSNLIRQKGGNLGSLGQPGSMGDPNTLPSPLAGLAQSNTPENPNMNLDATNIADQSPITQKLEANRITNEKNGQAQSVAGLNAINSRNPLTASQGNLSGLHNFNNYTKKLNDDAELQQIKSGGNLRIVGKRSIYGNSDDNNASPNFDAAGEVGGMNKAARVAVQSSNDQVGAENNQRLKNIDMQGHDLDNQDVNKQKQQTAEDKAQSQIMLNNARAFKQLHPNPVFKTVDGRMKAFDPSDMEHPMDLGDAHLLGEDAEAQQLRMKQATSDITSARQKDVNADKPGKQISPAAYANAHRQATQEVLSDPSNAGMYSNLVNQPSKDNPSYTIKGLDDIAGQDNHWIGPNGSDNMDKYKELIGKIQSRAADIANGKGAKPKVTVTEVK